MVRQDETNFNHRKACFLCCPKTEGEEMTERKRTASELGLVVGNVYKVVGDSGHESRFPVGAEVRFIHDDTTSCPKFENIATGYKGFAYAEAMVAEEKVEKAMENTATEVAPLKNYIIDVTDVETTVRVGKLLSSDQLKRIIDILGE
jgi:hypothetical protein